MRRASAIRLQWRGGLPKPGSGRNALVALVLLAFAAALPWLLALPETRAATTTTLTFSANADAQVREAQPTTNFGTSALRADGGSDPDVESDLRFQVTGVSGPVQSAKLRVYATSGTADGPAAYSTSWTGLETALSWSNRPARTSAATDDKGAISAGAWVEWDVKSLVSGNGTHSFILATTSTDGVDFSSREAADATRRPQLVLTVAGDPDTSPPTAPSGLTAHAASSTRVDLSWTAATDDVGVTGYRVYRDGSLIDTTGPVTSYSDNTAAPGTTYSYDLRALDAAGNVSEPSNTAAVTTPTTSPDPVVMAAGDIACDPSSASFNGGQGTTGACRQKATSDLIVAENPTAVLPLGDEQYCCATSAQFAASYDPSWGRVKSISHPAVGNHEYETPGASGYFDYFNGTGNPTGPAGDRTRGYYSFELGSWHLIALNSNCSQVGGCGAGSAQEQWLKADLASHPATCTLAYWHHPRFSSGTNPGTSAMQTFWQDLYNAKAEVVLSGHHHEYERFAPQTSTGAADPLQGLREFVVGTGGNSRGSFGAIQPNSEVRANPFGVLELTLRANSYDWQFQSAAGSSFSDAGSAPCHP
jgi:hypothetical protein